MYIECVNHSVYVTKKHNQNTLYCPYVLKACKLTDKSDSRAAYVSNLFVDGIGLIEWCENLSEPQLLQSSLVVIVSILLRITVF